MSDRLGGLRLLGTSCRCDNTCDKCARLYEAAVKSEYARITGMATTTARVVGTDPSVTPTYEAPDALRRVTCKRCASIVEYSAVDTFPTHDYTGGRNDEDGVQCPNCQYGIGVPPYKGYTHTSR